MNMVWLAILTTVAGLGPRCPGPTPADRGPSTTSLVRSSDHRPSSIPLDLTVIEDRDVEADLDDSWLPPAVGLALDPFDWLTWSIPGNSVDKRRPGRPEGRFLVPIPLRC